MPRVSVIIPSYNHEKYIAETIESVLNQSYQDFEIVIVDDGSSDKTVDIISQFSDERIRLFQLEKNRGASVAANKCVREAKGEFVAMLSSDDIFMHDKLEKQVAFLEKNTEIAAVFSYAQIVGEDGRNSVGEQNFYQKAFIQPNRTRFEWLNHFFFYGNCLCHPSVLIRKQCYGVVGSYDERFAQLPDLDFWIRLCSKYDIYVIPENLIKFRVRKHQENASGNRPEVKIRHMIELSQILKNYLSLENRDNFSKIFPEAAGSKTGFRNELLPFYIANFALKVNSPSHKYFAISTFYQLFNDTDIAQKLRSDHSFDFADLIRLSGEYDVFGTIAQEEIERLKHSKFWKIRAQWLTFKKLLGLTKHD
ncbi:glycosyltransferase [Leptolyngbya sp. FACHB-261]|uniref:glycosyltransferase n=1 Tax=Leptolyngbya sp. FACHB-261 TaxID=2692806 RepID=UPI001686219A|nr:glycosyltransferase [Leptolyngbya sp. FACHB-261]MBD2104419.1 glycosyltransferase [Leptolyngbya sp. FACHB-261]